MNTVDQSHAENPADSPAETFTQEQGEASPPIEKPQITGFDPSSRPLWIDPSIYLSIAVVFSVALVSLNKTPIVFWTAFSSMSLFALLFHLVAERILFRTRKEFQYFRAPLEGVFVVTLGSIIPGLALLGYGIYALCTGAQQTNLPTELGKTALLLVVPLFNFSVWSAMRRGYIMRPRLIGLMNGLAVGLSASWSLIWLKCLFVHSATECKFGWMLLLCTSPFLLFAAVCLCFDLWRKTEPRIRSITSVFGMLGGALSLMFVFMPLVNAYSVQSLLNDARTGSGDKQLNAINTLRTVTTDDELKSAPDRVSGFALAELLVPNHTLHADSDVDQDVYFRITGKPYADKPASAKAVVPLVGTTQNRVDGLSLAKSQMNGKVNPATLSASIEWAFSLHNSTHEPQEALADIKLPKGAVVSDAVLWINGQPRHAAYGATANGRAAFAETVRRQRDPLLLSQEGADRLVMDCFPVPAYGGQSQIHITFTIPLRTDDGKTCSMELPTIIKSNFAQPKRHRFAIAENINGNERTIHGVVRSGKPTPHALTFDCRSAAQPSAVLDARSGRFIVHEMRRERIARPTQVFVVIDSSISLKKDANQIAAAVNSIPHDMHPSIYVVPEPAVDDASGEDAPKFVDTATASFNLADTTFGGGRNNEPALRAVLETAAEQPNSAVLWIHGPQPFLEKQPNPLLDLTNAIKLYSLQVEPGPSTTDTRLVAADASNLLSIDTLPHKDSVSTDISNLLGLWKSGYGKLIGATTAASSVPSDAKIIGDNVVQEQLTALWANAETNEMLSAGKRDSATELATKYRIVTPVTAAVVLENPLDYLKFQLDPSRYDGLGSINDTYRGMHQWFNDDFVGDLLHSAFGQSNEVGQLADYGYDTARDISRLVTLAALLLSIVVAVLHLRTRKKITLSAIFKTLGLVIVVPLAVHLMGTFLINNFGGLGGGL